MNACDILDAVNTAKARFGAACGKYSGALTVELVRDALEKEGVHTSPRDVYILGLPMEIDLVIPSRNAQPLNRLLYAATDVLAVVEIKNAGSFGAKTIKTVRDNFQKVNNVVPSITCCYVTLAERKGFKSAVTSDNSGGEAYTLFWHTGSRANLKHHPTGDWERFVKDMRRLQQEEGTTLRGLARRRSATCNPVLD
jgi:hypothetical protein